MIWKLGSCDAVHGGSSVVIVEEEANRVDVERCKLLGRRAGHQQRRTS